MFALLAASVLPGLAWAEPGRDFEEGYALADSKGCFECHTVGRTDVGPSFSEIARRYRFDPLALERLPYVLRNGEVGHWGRRLPMWPQVNLTDDEIRQLVSWVLSQ